MRGERVPRRSFESEGYREGLCEREHVGLVDLLSGWVVVVFMVECVVTTGWNRLRQIRAWLVGVEVEGE